jgi:hypothetical protein
MVAMSPATGTPVGPHAAAFSNTSDDPFQTLTAMILLTSGFG